jgi:hypothetical protein
MIQKRNVDVAGQSIIEGRKAGLRAEEKKRGNVASL